jgi:5'(3')-deoxyribonucleotidase
MVEPLKKKNSYTNYNGEVFSPTNVGNIDLYNALVIISQQLDDIKHQHVESPEPKPVEQSFKEFLDEKPKGLIDTLRENALDELVMEKITKAEQAPVNYNIRAVPNSEYIKTLLLQEMGKEPGLSSLGFYSHLRMTGYTTAIIEEVVSNDDVVILTDTHMHKVNLADKSEIPIREYIYSLNGFSLSKIGSDAIIMVDNGFDLSDYKGVLESLAQTHKVITFSDIK